MCYLAWWRPGPDSRLNLASCLQSGHSGGVSSHRSASCAGLGRGTAAPDGPEMDLWCCLLIRPERRGERHERKVGWSEEGEDVR